MNRVWDVYYAEEISAQNPYYLTQSSHPDIKENLSLTEMNHTSK